MSTVTERQRQVISGLSRGLCQREIAAELGIATRTVKYHSDMARMLLRVPVARKLPEALRAYDLETTAGAVARSGGETA